MWLHLSFHLHSFVACLRSIRLYLVETINIYCFSYNSSHNRNNLLFTLDNWLRLESRFFLALSRLIELADLWRRNYFFSTFKLIGLWRRKNWFPAFRLFDLCRRNYFLSLCRRKYFLSLCRRNYFLSTLKFIDFNWVRRSLFIPLLRIDFSFWLELLLFLFFHNRLKSSNWNGISYRDILWS